MKFGVKKKEPGFGTTGPETGLCSKFITFSGDTAMDNHFVHHVVTCIASLSTLPK